MTEPEHLRSTTSDRGFRLMPEIRSSYPGASVRVYESSSASGPHIWLAATSPVDANKPDGPANLAHIHLTWADAVRLAEQLRTLARLHYQAPGAELDFPDSTVQAFADAYDAGNANAAAAGKRDWTREALAIRAGLIGAILDWVRSEAP